LLGQGDMMQYLMDLLFNELKKPATQIYKHNLLNILETAIRASNAQYHDQDCLKRLNIKLMDSSTGDTGWDIFVLEYNVDIPLNVIFSKNLLKDYQKLFFFFWKLKRLEFSQDHQIWRNFMTHSHSLKSKFDYLRPYIQKSMLFNRQIIHFVNNLHNYITLEVLETEYKKIIEKLSTIKKMDDLIELHKKFVESVIEQSLLNSEYNLIYKKILQIFDLIFRFKTAQDVLITTLMEEFYRNMDVIGNRENVEYII
jgi:gamma-tubulin complex component 3